MCWCSVASRAQLFATPWDCTHDIYAVCDANGKYGVINAKGNLVLDYQYESIGIDYARRNIHEDFIYVRDY